MDVVPQGAGHASGSTRGHADSHQHAPGGLHKVHATTTKCAMSSCMHTMGCTAAWHTRAARPSASTQGGNNRLRNHLGKTYGLTTRPPPSVHKELNIDVGRCGVARPPGRGCVVPRAKRLCTRGEFALRLDRPPLYGPVGSFEGPRLCCDCCWTRKQGCNALHGCWCRSAGRACVAATASATSRQPPSYKVDGPVGALLWLSSATSASSSPSSE